MTGAHSVQYGVPCPLFEDAYVQKLGGGGGTKGGLTSADRGAFWVRDVCGGGGGMNIQNTLQKGYQTAKVWGLKLERCQSSGPRTENGPEFLALRGPSKARFCVRSAVLCPRNGPETWGKSRPEMDSAPLKSRDTMWILSVGRRLCQFAVGWGGWLSVGVGWRQLVHPTDLQPTPSEV